MNLGKYGGKPLTGGSDSFGIQDTRNFIFSVCPLHLRTAGRGR